MAVSQGVTNANGTATYAFDKSPVVVTFSNSVSGIWPHDGSSWVTTFHTQGGAFSVSTVTQNSDYNWVQSGPLYGSVADANIHGEMVGGTVGNAALGVMGIPGVGMLGIEGIVPTTTFVNRFKSRLLFSGRPTG